MRRIACWYICRKAGNGKREKFLRAADERMRCAVIPYPLAYK